MKAVFNTFPALFLLTNICVILNKGIFIFRYGQREVSEESALVQRFPVSLKGFQAFLLIRLLCPWRLHTLDQEPKSCCQLCSFRNTRGALFRTVDQGRSRDGFSLSVVQ